MPYVVIADERVDVPVGVPRGGTNDACLMACAGCEETFVLLHTPRHKFSTMAKAAGWTWNHVGGWLCPECSKRRLARLERSES